MELLEAIRLSESPGLLRLALDDLPELDFAEVRVLLANAGEVAAPDLLARLLRWVREPPPPVEPWQVLQALQEYGLRGRGRVAIRAAAVEVLETSTHSLTLLAAVTTLAQVPGAATRTALSRFVDAPEVGPAAKAFLQRLGGVDRCYFGRDTPVIDPTTPDPT
jgi:hypothetical protein